ncbi:MAG TPA: zf-HC2 domain-containing protein [Anaerolineae bacterium]|nr:zf-HC2 domain-containing protein [Anaerolineae bacterium]HNU05617.1 zf-HC2 domain-containing protein [Anaerolineae bacterium]
MNTHDHDHGDCRQLLKDLSDYIDGDLDETLCVEIERHMNDCDNCRVVVDTLRKTVSLYHDLPATPMPAEVEERLFRCLDLEAFVGAER